MLNLIQFVFLFFVFFLQNQHHSKCFFRAQGEKVITQHIDASSVVWILINNGKLDCEISSSCGKNTMFKTINFIFRAD